MQTTHQTTVTARDSNLPVTLAEAKQHLRILGEDLDADVQAALEAAVAWCESACGRALRVSHTLTQRYACWPKDPVRFDREPVSAITSVTYYDADEASQTLASSNYRLLGQSEAGAFLEWDDDFTKPTLDDRADAVTITYTAGYGTIAAVPAEAKHAVKLALSLFFGDLGDREVEPTRAACRELLSSLDWGAYR